MLNGDDLRTTYTTPSGRQYTAPATMTPDDVASAINEQQQAEVIVALVLFGVVVTYYVGCAIYSAVSNEIRRRRLVKEQA